MADGEQKNTDFIIAKILDDYNLYDDASHKDFEPLLKLAKFITQCSKSFISFIEDDVQYVRFVDGLETVDVPLQKTVCQFVYHSGQSLEIEDLTKNDLTAKIIESNDYPFKYYYGIPLINSESKVLGTLCVLNETPKKLEKEQRENLNLLADQVLNTLQLRKKSIEDLENIKRTNEFLNLINSSPDLICMLDQHQNILSANDSLGKILGYDKKEFIGSNMMLYITPEDQTEVANTINGFLKEKKKQFSVEFRLKTKNKALKWISWNAITKNRYWFVTGRDITQSKETLQQLNQLSTVASKINNGVVISDNKSQVVWVNNAFSEITGYKIEDLQYQKLGDVIIGAESNLDLIERARMDTLNKKSFSVELLAYRKDGQPIWLSIYNTIILDDKGNLDSLIEIVIDISERKKAEEQLELLSLVASKTENGVSISDKAGRVKWINESLYNKLGYSLEELMGKRIGDVVNGVNTNNKAQNEARALAAKGLPYDLDLEVYKKNGEPIWLSVSSSPILDASGQVDKHIEIINDITQRKKVEKQLLEAKEQALQLSRAKEMFLSVMSHEIRTPLNSIIGITNILSEEEKLDHQEQNIELLKFSSDNLLNLINDILDFTKLEVGKVDLERKRLNVRELVKDIVNSLSYKIEEKGIEIRSEIDEKIPELVRGDKTRLYQILINLLNNAIKFTDNGFVSISLKLIKIGDQKTTIHFNISDSGIGIPDDKKEYIFETFSQASLNTTRKYGGTGLGLSITKGLVELFGGKIKLSSKVGKGSSFYFDISFENFKEEVPTQQIDENAILENKRILVVDDNDINRLLAKKILSNHKLIVQTAESGDEALSILCSKDIDLVLMDIHMPGKSGYDTVAEIRGKTEDYYKNLPVIALTASVIKDDISTIYKYGMTDYQLKPYKPDELLKKIKKYLLK